MGILLDRLKVKADRIFTKSNGNTLMELIRANLKVRDYNSILGIFWSLLGPVVTLVILYFIFRTSFGPNIKAYPLYILVGVVCTNFFITATAYTVNIFFINREIILNSTVPRETIVASALAIHIYKFIIDLFLCFIVSIFYGCLTWKFFLLILPLLTAFIAFVAGINMILSLLYCLAGDVEHIWMLATRLLYFATPIFYSLNSIPSTARKLIYFGNPLSPFVISFQNIFIGNVNILLYLYNILMGIVFFIFGYRIFMLIENTAVEQA